MGPSAGQRWMRSSPSEATPTGSSSITSATAIPTNRVNTLFDVRAGRRRRGALARKIGRSDRRRCLRLLVHRQPRAPWEADRAAASGRRSWNGDPHLPTGERRPLRRRPHTSVVHDAAVQDARRRTAHVGRAALEARVRSLLPAGVLPLLSRYTDRGRAGLSGDQPARRGPRTSPRRSSPGASPS
jgi:hypothetical protein